MEMKEFQEKLGRLLEKAESQDKNLSNDEILQIFGLNRLSTQQLQSLYEYLRIQGVRIQGIELKKMDIESRIQAEDEQQVMADEPGERTDSVCRQGKKQLVPLEREDEACLKEYREYQDLLTVEKDGERERLLSVYAAGDHSVLERLAQIYLPDILEYARELYEEGIFIGDLIQEGNMSLLTAPIEDMPGSPADQWMREQIYAGMKKWLEEQAEQKLQDHYMVEKVRKLEAAIRELSDDDNQKFSIEELSAFLEMDEEEIRAVLSLTGEGTEDTREN